MALSRLFHVAIASTATATDQPTLNEADSISCLQLGFSAPTPSPSPSLLSVSPSPSPTADSFANTEADSDTVDCDLMVLTTYFTTKRDWQRNVSAPVEFWMMQDFYESARENHVNVTVLYDVLPDDFVLEYETDHFKFQKIDLNEYDALQGLNDVRFSMIRDVVDRNPSWRSIFLTDLFDVKIGRNPCSDMMDQKLYVGRERDRLHHNSWMEKRFVKMGGKYEEFFHKASRMWYLLNAGVVGGRREIFTRFLKEMTDVLDDPGLIARQHHEQENVNMAAFNYVVRVGMGLGENAEEGQPGWVSGPPVHSEYKWYEDDRKDVWFIHK